MCPDNEEIDSGPSRRLTSEEDTLLRLLLSSNFPGDANLREQLPECKVCALDANGSLRITAEAGKTASVVRRIPVEAEYDDADGVGVHVLLHVLEGFLHELEVYREDSNRVQIPATRAQSIQVLTL